MCVSLLVENDPDRLASVLDISVVPGMSIGGSRRVEARGIATVLRIGAGGRLIGEAMAFNPYILRRSNVAGDLWAHSLLGESHGLLAVRGFSEWTSADRLVRTGMANIFEVNCAFNRFAFETGYGFSPAAPRDRMVLGNFKPTSDSIMLVPVLFDVSRRPDAHLVREFAIISRDPSAGVAHTGAAHAPVSLTGEAALAWINATDPGISLEDDGQDIHSVDIDLDEVLEDGQDETFQFSLFKSA